MIIRNCKELKKNYLIFERVPIQGNSLSEKHSLSQKVSTFLKLFTLIFIRKNTIKF